VANKVFTEMCLLDEEDRENNREPHWQDMVELANRVKAYDNSIDVSYLAETNLLDDRGLLNTQGSDYGYGIAIVEEPNRAITQLRNLARGHALSQGRDYITIEDDIPILIKVVMSNASIERSLIFDILIANDGVLVPMKYANI